MKSISYLIVVAIILGVVLTSCKEDEVNQKEFYSVTVSCDENGTAGANVTSAVEGELITLTASANSGYCFAEWQIIEGGITLSGTTENPATFIMPDEAVEVKAIFVQQWIGLLESIIVSRENYYPTLYKYEYDSHNRITENAQYRYDTYYDRWINECDITLDYDINGDLVEFYVTDGHYARDTRATFSRNGNIITFIINYHPDANLFGSVIGELELNNNEVPVKLTFEKVEDWGVEYLHVSTSYTVVTLTWQNENLTKTDWETEYTYSRYDDETGELIEREDGSSVGTNTYTHDEKNTPFFHCNTPKWFLWWLDYYGYNKHIWYNKNYGYNKNNIRTESEDGSIKTFEYTYDDNGFPITRTWATSSENTTETFTYKPSLLIKTQ